MLGTRYDAFREGERSGWDARASRYSDATACATLQSIPTLLAHAHLFPGARVLDAGCGPGYVAACANTLGAISMGIDFSPNMIAEARTRYPGIVFEVGDVEHLALEDGSQDVVLSNIVLFHVSRPERAMAEAYRVLTPGGRFAFSQWLGPSVSECYELLFEVLGANVDVSRADPAPDAFALSDQNGVAKMMESAGFTGLAFEEVRNVLHAKAASFFDFFMRFGVRVPLIVQRQDSDVRAKIRREVDAQAARYLKDGTYKIPMPSLIVSGQRPFE